MPKYSASEMPTTRLGTWPKTWPTSRSCTMTHDGRNRTPYGPLPTPMPSAASSHASSMTPQQPQTSLRLCSMPALTTSRMDGNMAPNSIMNAANGARGMGTPRATVRALTNACSVTGQGIKNLCVASLTKGAEQEEYAVSLMTTQGWPIPTAHQTSGPLDNGRDVNKGVMSQETSHT
jgi:hypothetical protein